MYLMLSGGQESFEIVIAYRINLQKKSELFGCNYWSNSKLLCLQLKVLPYHDLWIRAVSRYSISSTIFPSRTVNTWQMIWGIKNLSQISQILIG